MPAIVLLVNGTRRTLDVPPGTPLLTALRDHLDLTGAKFGCGEGSCGACTVLVGGRPVRSCITPLSAVAGRSITTIEGLEKDGKLHPVQEAFLETGAYQCGFCTPAMILSVVALLEENPDPTPAEIRKGLDSNVCRCGVYPGIVEAVRKAAQAMKKHV
jgi:aerobic-type carbon monoxide dehydrogenase small subunit (CoxS/CutS family)